MANERKVVWLLGAGFSAPLGVPQLGQMFDAATTAMLVAWFERHGQDHAHLRASAEAYQGLNREDRRIVRDAEGYLDLLERSTIASTQAHAVKILEYGLPETPRGRLAENARQYLAHACHAPVFEGDFDGEAWQPFIAWARLLTSADTIVTFNYDRVVETARRLAVGATAGACIVRPPTEPLVPGDAPTLLKLHGSVDWYLGAGDPPAIELDGRLGPLLAHDPVLVPPGPAKGRIAGTALDANWTLALDAIRAADAIVFIGYRFSPGDSYALGRVVDALRGSALSKPKRNIHVVLGPKRDDDAERAIQITAWAAGLQEIELPQFRLTQRYNDEMGCIVHHRLWGQDFLTVLRRDELLPL